MLTLCEMLTLGAVHMSTQVYSHKCSVYMWSMLTSRCNTCGHKSMSVCGLFYLLLLVHIVGCSHVHTSVLTHGSVGMV